MIKSKLEDYLETAPNEYFEGANEKETDNAENQSQSDTEPTADVQVRLLPSEPSSRHPNPARSQRKKVLKNSDRLQPGNFGIAH